MENYMTSETREKPMTKTRSLVYCALFTALIAVGAFIKIPIPVVPFTLQYCLRCWQEFFWDRDWDRFPYWHI